MSEASDRAMSLSVVKATSTNALSLERTLLVEARRERFNGVGRILLSDFTTSYGWSRDAIVRALRGLNHPYRIMGNVCAIHFPPSKTPAIHDCSHAIKDRYGDANCIRGDSTIGYCQMPCPYEPELRRLVIFAILMEHGEGILAKRPEYIAEKFINAMTVPYPENLLDLTNKRKFKRWCEKRAAGFETEVR